MVDSTSCAVSGGFTPTHCSSIQIQPGYTRGFRIIFICIVETFHIIIYPEVHCISWSFGHIFL